jgi:hypothetical protein
MYSKKEQLLNLINNINVENKNYSKSYWWGVNNPYADEMESYSYIKAMFISNNASERAWINECWKLINDKIGLWADNLDYIQILESILRSKNELSR